MSKTNWILGNKSFEKVVILPLEYSDKVDYEFYNEGVVVSVPVDKELPKINIGLNSDIWINKKDLIKSGKYIPVEWFEREIEIAESRGLDAPDTYFAKSRIELWKYKIENDLDIL